MGKMRFESLPLVESVIRLSFRTPMELTFSHFNAIFEKSKSEFSLLTDSSSFEPAPGMSGPQVYGPGANSLRLENRDKGTSLTVQSNLLCSRWEQPPFGPTSNYVGFEYLFEHLMNLFELVGEITDRPSPSVANMVYVDFVQADAFDLSVIEKFVKTSVIPTHCNRPHGLYKHLVSWIDENSVDLTLDIQRATVEMQDGSTTGFSLASAGGMTLANDTNVKDSVKAIHSALIHNFDLLMTDHAKQIWGYLDR